MNLIDEAFEKAKETLRMNITPRGFSAASRCDDEPDTHYKNIWTRDAAITSMWILPLQDDELTEVAKKSIQTIFDAQTRDGHLPNLVHAETGEPEYQGIGNIACIDGPMWATIALTRYAHVTGDRQFALDYFDYVHKSMKWLRSLDSNNCGLLEIPEASDWTDLFPRSFNVLYDEVLWYRANVDFVELRKWAERSPERYEERASRIRGIINERFWPSGATAHQTMETHWSGRVRLGRGRYLIAQITPFGFDWRCDVYGNLLAYMFSLLGERRATAVWRFLRQVGADKPHPIQVLYPAIRPNEARWRDYFLINLLNLPHHYHNGGIWPYVGGLWVRFLLKLGERTNAEEALESLAKLNKQGIYHDWEFNEWAHGETGEVMGRAHQSWSAASYIAAYMQFQGDTTLQEAQTSVAD